MDPQIVIDDDFTVDVLEEDDEDDDFSIEECYFEPLTLRDVECDPEVTITTDIEIKQEFDIDIEDNYLTTDEFIDILQIKTEIESLVDETETDTCSGNDQLLPTVPQTDTTNIHDEHLSVEDPPLTSSENVEVAPVPDNIPNNVIPLSQPTLDREDSDNITLVVPASDKENISASKPLSVAKQPNKQRIPDVKQKPVARTSNKPKLEPLDRRKKSKKKKKYQQIPKVPSASNQRWQSYNERSVVPFNYKNHRKSSSSKFYKNQKYQIVSHKSTPPNQFFPRRPRFTKFPEQQNGMKSRYETWSNGRGSGMSQNYPPVYDTSQSTFDVHTYNTILNALNQIMQQNQNNSTFDAGNSAAVVPRRRNRRNRQFWRWSKGGRKHRPQVWSPEARDNTPFFEASSAQLHTYTTFLQAFTQLSGGIVGQNCGNYTTFARDVTFEMSFLNVRGSY